jgi:hypothetical protein
MKKLLLVLLTTVIALQGCESNTEDDLIKELIDGSFELTFEGAFNMTSSGEATFLHVKSNQEGNVVSTLGISLSDDSESEFIGSATVILREDASGVQEGQYTITIDPSNESPEVAVGFFTPLGFIAGKSGTLTLTDIQDGTVKGSLDATFAGGPDSNENETSISGTFRATGVTQSLE